MLAIHPPTPLNPHTSVSYFIPKIQPTIQKHYTPQHITSKTSFDGRLLRGREKSSQKDFLPASRLLLFLGARRGKDSDRKNRKGRSWWTTSVAREVAEAKKHKAVVGNIGVVRK